MQDKQQTLRDVLEHIALLREQIDFLQELVEEIRDNQQDEIEEKQTTDRRKTSCTKQEKRVLIKEA